MTKRTFLGLSRINLLAYTYSCNLILALIVLCCILEANLLALCGVPMFMISYILYVFLLYSIYINQVIDRCRTYDLVIIVFLVPSYLDTSKVAINESIVSTDGSRNVVLG